MKIGIIGAMHSEVVTIKDAMENKKTSTIAGMEYCEGKLDGVDVIVVQCGIGKVNAGICAQVLINSFGAECVVNTGVAGSLDARIDIGDIVVAVDAVQHDFDLTPWGYPPGKLAEVDVVAFPTDEKMRTAAVNAVKESFPEIHVFEGRVCTGDQFIASKKDKERIIETFNGICCEMEGGSIAQVCYLNRVPFVIIRAISDKADDSDEVAFFEFEEAAAKRCAGITRYIIKHL